MKPLSIVWGLYVFHVQRDDGERVLPKHSRSTAKLPMRQSKLIFADVINFHGQIGLVSISSTGKSDWYIHTVKIHPKTNLEEKNLVRKLSTGFSSLPLIQIGKQTFPQSFLCYERSENFLNMKPIENFVGSLRKYWVN